MTTIDLEAEVTARMRERMREAASLRLAARGGDGDGRARGRSLADYGWRLRQAAGFGLVRTGLRLLDPGRVES
jgi:hypothetical protein